MSAITANSIQLTSHSQIVDRPFFERGNASTQHGANSTAWTDSVVGADAKTPTAEFRVYRSDDATAGAMVAIILSMAFLVLLGLATAVNIWMGSFAS